MGELNDAKSDRTDGEGEGDLPPRQASRQTLIDATLDSIAEIGLIRTSVSEIISRAGLSRGMIHLHFQGKENLLVAAAAFSSDRYHKRLGHHLERAKPGPQFRIEALILCDLSEEGLNENIVRTTHEFQGATRAFPMLAPYSDTRDTRLRTYFEQAFEEIFTQLGETDPKLAAQDMTTGLVAMMEGLWVDYLLHPKDFDRAQAARIVFRTLAGILPRYFGLAGALETAS
ncbi:MAG: TetR family transcriptional regulator C-terminal domain-containing protein [Pseudomonadota bacterium]